jgi:hypothetical protein
MERKRDLRDQIVRLQYRIAELEERLCPCEEHDWKRIGGYPVWGTGGYTFDATYVYKCRRCGKQRESSV